MISSSPAGAVPGGMNGAKPVEALTRAYQCAPHTPSLSRGPAGQASIAGSKARSSAEQSSRNATSGA